MERKELLQNWINNKNKDIEKLGNILKKVKKIDSGEIKVSLENKIVEWVLEITEKVKEMERLNETSEEER